MSPPTRAWTGWSTCRITATCSRSRWAAVAAHARVELTIVEVYPGSKYRDTCIGFLSPDFEEIERRNMEATDSPPGAAQGDVAPADVSPGISPDVSPDGGDDRGLGELGFPGDAGLDLPRE